MQTDAGTDGLGLDRLAILERRQRRATRGMIVLAAVALAQAAVLAYLLVPFSRAAKHPISLQAGKFELVDANGTGRAELTADPWQTMLALSDARGRLRVHLRENKQGFVSMDFYDQNFDQKSVSLLSGTEVTFLELLDPKTRQRIRVQAAADGVGVSRFDERGQAVP